MNMMAQTLEFDRGRFDEALAELEATKADWARTSAAERVRLLEEVKDCLLSVSEGWVETSARKKQIPSGSPLVGEEWLTGPYALMSACNGLIKTLRKLENKKFLRKRAFRKTSTGQAAVKVMPDSFWDLILLSGVKAEIWMKPGIDREMVADHAAVAYDVPAEKRDGKIALVLGAGNVASIAPLDAFQKLFLENQVVVLKVNPVNDYLAPYWEAALRPLIARGALRLVKGGGAAGAYLTEHPLVDEIHITGAGATHDLIVWGGPDEAEANKAAGAPKNKRRVTSELGAVCPTIVVPGPWSAADIRFQAQNLATQKMQNSGFNCVACQALIVPKTWDKTEALLKEMKAVVSECGRGAYYPGAEDRLSDFEKHGGRIERVERGAYPPLVIAEAEDAEARRWYESHEIFAPALYLHRLEDPDPETYLRAAISYANEHLHGTLGGNILIHPRTVRQIGKKRFEEIIAEFRYGCVAINTWTGVGFVLHLTTWGAFPGHTLDNIESGIGTVHNTYMLEETERTVVEVPWRPFPRNLLSGRTTLMPRPPWFLTHRRQDRLGPLLVKFQHRPSIFKLPRIMLNALLG